MRVNNLCLLLVGFSSCVRAVTLPPVTASPQPRLPAVITSVHRQIIITHTMIQDSGATTLSALLSQYSQLQVQDLTGDGSEVSIGLRGFGENASSNVLILINGIPQNNPDLASVNLNRLPIGDVERVVIMPGSQSVLYGDEAVGGVINIVTRQPQSTDTAIGSGLGRFNHQFAFARHSDQLKNGLAYSLSANGDFTNNYRDHNRDNQGHFLADTRYHTDAGWVGLRYGYYRQYLQYAGALTEAQVQENRRQAQPGTDNVTHNQQHDILFDWRQALSPHWVMRQALSYRHYDAQGELFGPMTQSRDVIVFHPRWLGHIKRHHWQFGLDNQYDWYRLDATGDRDHTRQMTMAGYTHWAYAFNPSWKIELGVRGAMLDAPIDHDQVLVSMQGIRWQLSPAQSVTLRRTGNYRFPKAEENANTPVSVQHLDTQTGVDYALGYHVSAHGWQFNTTIFDLRLRNEIMYDPYKAAGRPFGENRNLPSTNRLGVNVDASCQVMDRWQLNGQYSMVDARFRRGAYKGKRIPLVATHRFTLASAVSLSSHWRWGLDTQYTGHRYGSGDDQNRATGLPATVLFNTHLNWRYQHWHATLTVNNVFNRLYNTYATYVSSSNTEYYYPAAGRVWLVQLSWQ